METKDLSSSQFADAMEVPRAVLSHVLSGRNKPSLDVVLKIASTYTDVSLEWLMLGKGEMLNSLVTKTASSEPLKAAGSTEPADTVSPVQQKSNKVEVQEKEDKLKDGSTQVTSGRMVRQVMILYTDGTFEAYVPGVG